MDLILGKVAFTPKGEYNRKTIYERYDMVFDSLRIYVSLKDNNLRPLTDANAWRLIIRFDHIVGEIISVLTKTFFESPSISIGGDIYIRVSENNVKLQDVLQALATAANVDISSLATDEQESGETPSGDTIDDNVPVWYVGQVNATEEEFAALTAGELMSNAGRYPTTDNEVTFRINKSCWFVMVPDGTEVDSASYTASGIESTFDDEEVIGDFGSEVYHNDVVISGTTYHVYVNRNTALVGSNALGKFTLK